METPSVEDLYGEVKRQKRRYRANPRKNYGALQEAWEALKSHGEALMDDLRETAGIETRTDHAYTPRETGSHGGSDHIVVLDDLHEGRLHREAGDALCKPAKKFWGLTHTHGGGPSCKTCLERAERIVAKHEDRP